tara:strand:- start:1012 stop:1410 length:399 start_codon:yes stop_codon:yes gene_type:complete
MIGFVMVGTNDLDKAINFYDSILDTIDLKRVDKTDTYGSYSPKNKPEAVEFYITTPFNNENATVGNGTQISFYIDSKDNVDLFHATALSLGAKDEGAPGERYEGEYYSYFRDLDGNKICGYTYLKNKINYAM